MLQMKKDNKNKAYFYIEKIGVALADLLSMGLKEVDTDEKFLNLQAQKYLLTSLVGNLQEEGLETYQKFVKVFEKKSKRLVKGMYASRGFAKEVVFDGVIDKGKFNLNLFVLKNQPKTLKNVSLEAQELVLREMVMEAEEKLLGEVNPARKLKAINSMIDFNKKPADAKKYVYEEIEQMGLNHSKSKHFMLKNIIGKYNGDTYESSQVIYTTPHTYSSLVAIRNNKKVSLLEENITDKGMAKELK